MHAPPPPPVPAIEEALPGIDEALRLSWADVTYITVVRRHRDGDKERTESLLRLSIGEEASPCHTLQLAIARKLRADELDQSRDWWRQMSQPEKRQLVVDTLRRELANERRGLFPGEAAVYRCEILGPKSTRLANTTLHLAGPPQAPDEADDAPDAALSASGARVAGAPLVPGGPDPRSPGWLGELMGILEDNDDPAVRMLVTVAMVSTQHRHEMQEAWSGLFYQVQEQYKHLQARTGEMLAAVHGEAASQRSHARALQANQLRADQAKADALRQEVEGLRLERRLHRAEADGEQSTRAAVLDNEVKREAISRFGDILNKGIGALMVGKGMPPQLAELVQQLPAESLDAFGGLMQEPAMVEALKSPNLHQFLADAEGRAFLVDTFTQLAQPEPATS